jgi:hypothetical protein|tara:strand:- start:2585 stop:2938 length:354 start_codon:yes stop_codon:yes gene_type:complete
MIRLGDVELEKAVENLRNLGKQLGKAESEYQYYESMMKTKKATIFLETKNMGYTIRDREAMSEVHEEVIKFIPLIKEQKEKYISLRHEISSVLESCNLFRTKSANMRGEKKLYGELG